MSWAAWLGTPKTGCSRWRPSCGVCRRVAGTATMSTDGARASPRSTPTSPSTPAARPPRSARSSRATCPTSTGSPAPAASWTRAAAEGSGSPPSPPPGGGARGRGANAAFVAAGRERGLDMELGDALGYLEALPRDSIDMVTAFHVIEHLPTEDLLALLEAAKGALRPGGCLLLETPNPTNLVMAACDFYNDPTHRSPLPPALTEYLVSTQGFGDVEVRPLHPKTSALTPPGGADACARVHELVAQTLFGPQDYAVLGYKLPAEER